MPSLLTCVCADAGQLITFPEENCLVSLSWLRLILSHMSVGAGPKSHSTQTMLHGKHITPGNAFPSNLGACPALSITTAVSHIG